MRAEFSKQTKREAWLRADGHCEGCGQAFEGRRPDYDHDKPAELGGDNSLENCKVLCPKCHRAKTLIEDMPRIVKSNRVREKRAGIRGSSAWAVLPAERVPAAVSRPSAPQLSNDLACVCSHRRETRCVQVLQRRSCRQQGKIRWWRNSSRCSASTIKRHCRCCRCDQDKLEAGLRRGDYNLLSYVLASGARTFPTATKRSSHQRLNRLRDERCHPPWQR